MATRHLMTATILSVLLIAPGALAQGQPNFSGIWMHDEGPPYPGVPSDPDLEAEVQVVHTPTSIAFGVRVQSKSKPAQRTQLIASTIWTDGRQMKVTAPDGTETTSSGSWQADKFVVKAVARKGGQVVRTTTSTWSLDSTGRLVIEQSVQALNQAQPVTIRIVHRRKK